MRDHCVWTTVYGPLCMDQTAGFGPKTADFGPKLADFGPKLADFGPKLADFGPKSPYFWTKIPGFGPKTPYFWTKIPGFGPYFLVQIPGFGPYFLVQIPGFDQKTPFWTKTPNVCMHHRPRALSMLYTASGYTRARASRTHCPTPSTRVRPPCIESVHQARLRIAE